MKHYPNVITVKMNDETIAEMDEYCEITEVTKSGFTRRAVKAMLKSPEVRKTLQGNDLPDFMVR
ncbi:hypothetical protein UR09_06840 [Candidatus Nitromaritima sp. SCGC AAA799-A02]|nr:hypothetical protein UR09_06840 [Candidatus Nitromaritima sp. SCGC AAA799-A02]